MVNHHYLNDILEIVDGLKNERSNLKNKKILLVGANGFLGKYFVKVFEKIIEFSINIKECYLFTNRKSCIEFHQNSF